MQILLAKPEFEDFIREQVDTGQFASASAVVGAALSRFMEPQFAPGELARLVAEGEASIAEHGLLDAEEVFRELKEKHREIRRRAGKWERLA